MVLPVQVRNAEDHHLALLADSLSADANTVPMAGAGTGVGNTTGTTGPALATGGGRHTGGAPFGTGATAAGTGAGTGAAGTVRPSAAQRIVGKF